MPETEVVKIRITSRAKKMIDDVSAKEYRTFQEQVRMVLDKWSETIELNKVSQEPDTPKTKQPTEVVKMRISARAKDMIDRVSIKVSRSFQEQVRWILTDWATKQTAEK